MTRGTKSTDPRDRVYAILGLADADNVRHNIQIDYSRSIFKIKMDDHSKPGTRKREVADIC